MISFFSKKAIGLDIADRTIEMAALEKKGSKIKVLSLGRVYLEPGVVERGRIKNEEKLTQAIIQVFSEGKLNFSTTVEIIFGVPDSQVYTRVLKLQPHTEQDRKNLVAAEAQKSIPLEEERLLLVYKVLSENKAGTEILLLATDKKVVQEWDNFFKKIGLKVNVFDVESLAIFRGLFGKQPKYSICILDIGAEVANIAIYEKNGLAYTHSINIAGNALTQEIAGFLKIDFAKAEQEKIKIGLSDKNNQIFPVLIKVLEGIVKETKATLSYFQDNKGQKVETLILVGGSSKLKGIKEYFAGNFDIPIEIGKSVLLADKPPSEYIGAVGLALRGVDREWAEKDLALLYREQEKLKFAKTPFAKIFKRKF